MIDPKTIWITSDHHFNHANIIKHAGRPFVDVDDMNFELVSRWNRVVGINDVVFHLGDFTLQGGTTAGKFFSKLNGHIHVLANQDHHDKNWLANKYLWNQWTTVFKSRSGNDVMLEPPIKVIKHNAFVKDGRVVPVVLCHFPMAQWHGAYYGSVHVHGHTHGSFQDSGNSLDVSVECTNYAPISLAEIMARFGYG